mmetsp:Transcript_45501/g.84317  ORF Transcript_45501/g.84317 Transcript_45501/m.84317 type:complete len:206 (-) Transcript_45501:875-1492(-)
MRTDNVILATIFVGLPSASAFVIQHLHTRSAAPPLSSFHTRSWFKNNSDETPPIIDNPLLAEGSVTTSAIGSSKDLVLPSASASRNPDDSSSPPNDNQEQAAQHNKIVFTSSLSKKPKQATEAEKGYRSWLSGLKGSFRKQRPGVKFRTTLLALSTAALASISLFRNPRSILVPVTKWLGHRGFQGLAALGRTIAYGWAVLVAYP